MKQTALVLLDLAATPAAAIEIATGKMVGSGYEARALYLETLARLTTAGVRVVPSRSFLIRILAVCLIACGVPCAGAGPLLQNGSFEEGLSGWIVRGSRVAATVVSDARDGTRALRVENRASRYDGPAQDVLAALREAGSRARYTSRLWIRLDAPASVRLRLQLTGADGTQRLILAERVIRAPGEWTRVEGTLAPVWTGTLASAEVSFDVAQLPESAYPSFTVDQVTVDPDSDGDGLTDSEEAAAKTDPRSTDTDGDGMPDGWEMANRLDPTVSNGTEDPDGDGFSNLQEYWAATDPRSAVSYPGKPANPNLSAEARAVLRYLALLPSRTANRVVVGQHCTDIAAEFEEQVAGLYAMTSYWPGLLSLGYEYFRQPLDVPTVTDYALKYWRAGGLVLVKWAPPNPWTGGVASDRSGGGDLKELLAAGTPVNKTWVTWLDEAAAGFARLRDAGVVVLWRPNSEMNGAWFWWGRRHRDDYIDMWRFMFDYFTRVKQLNNLIWVYESDSSVHDMVPADYYYPGDDVVDVAGHNFYHDTWDLPFDANRVFRDYPKVYAFPQAGPTKEMRDGSWNNMIMIDMIRARYPRCAFFSVWNTFRAGGVESKIAILHNRNARALLEDPWIVTRDEIQWRAAEDSRPPLPLPPRRRLP